MKFKTIFLLVILSNLIHVKANTEYSHNPYYSPSHSHQYQPPDHHHDYHHYHHHQHHRPHVPLNKLCSWKTLTWNNPVISNGSGICDWDGVGNYIIPRNAPSAFEIADDGRVFVGVRRYPAVAIYSTLNYFHIKDIQNGVCPPLNPYPSLELNQLLQPFCENPDRIINVDRFSIDSCKHDPKLWVVDTNGYYRSDRKSPLFGDGTLNIFSLTNDTLLRKISIPIDIDDLKGLGLTEVIVNVDPNDCENAYAYILDKMHAQIIVYSWAENRLWNVATPLFNYDSISTKFYVTTPKGTEVSYFVPDGISGGTVDHKKQQLIYHARASLNEFAIDIGCLHNRSINAGGPENIPIQHLGQKNIKGQTVTHQINPETNTVWGIQEQNYGIACWNRDKPLNPSAVNIVASCSKTLPYLVDLQRTIVPGRNCHGVFVLTNNQKGIQEDGFDPDIENYGIYYIEEKDAFHAWPECLSHHEHHYDHHKHHHYK